MFRLYFYGSNRSEYEYVKCGSVVYSLKTAHLIVSSRDRDSEFFRLEEITEIVFFQSEIR